MSSKPTGYGGVLGEYLLGEFKKPPLARLAELALEDEFDQLDALRSSLVCAERFAAFLGDPESRDSVKDLTSFGEAKNVAGFREMRLLADDLATALRKVFFDSFLSENARRYLVF